MIEVFKTNIETVRESNMVASRLQQSFPNYKVNFDLQDTDRILRIESPDSVDANSVTKLLQTSGFFGEVLPDVAVPFEFDLLDDCRLSR